MNRGGFRRGARAVPDRTSASRHRVDGSAKHLRRRPPTLTEVGLTQHLRKLTVTTAKERVLEVELEELTQAWRGTLDW